MLLKPRALQWVTAFKAASSAVIAIGIAMGLGWEHPYWAGISVMIVTLPYMGAALEKSLMRIAGTFLAALLAYVITIACAQNQIAYAAALMLVLLFTSYFGTGNWYPYTFTLAGITLSIICTLTYQNPTAIWDVAFYRSSEICLGVIVAMTVNAIILPQRAGDALFAKIGHELDSFGTLFDDVMAEFFDKDAQSSIGEAREQAIIASVAKLHPLYLQALRDSTRVSRHRDGMEHILICLETLLVTLTVLRRGADAKYPKAFLEPIRPEMEAFAAALHDDIRALSKSFQTLRPPANSRSTDAAAALDQRLEETRKQGLNFNYPLEDVSHLYAIIANLVDVHGAIQTLAGLTTDIQNGPRGVDRSTTPERTRKHSLPKIDIRRLQHGIKVGIVVLSALYLSQWLQWPGGLQGAITAAIVIQMSVVASNQKALLRLGGCLLGGACGAFSIIFFEPYFSSYYSFAFPLFVFFFIFSLINFGKPSFAYAGLQAFIAFLLMTSITNTQNVSLLPGVHRLTGIIMGVIICMVVQRLLWPVIPENELRKDFANFFKHAAGFLSAYTPKRLRGQNVNSELAQLTDRVSPVARSAENWLSQMGFQGSDRPYEDAIRSLSLSMQSLSYRTRALEQTFQRDMPRPLVERLSPAFIELNEAICESLNRMARAFDKNQPPDPVNFDPALGQLTRELHHIFREEHASRPYPGKQVAGLLGLARRYRALTIEAKNCQQLAISFDYNAFQRTPFI